MLRTNMIILQELRNIISVTVSKITDIVWTRLKTLITQISIISNQPQISHPIAFKLVLLAFVVSNLNNQ